MSADRLVCTRKKKRKNKQKKKGCGIIKTECNNELPITLSTVQTPNPIKSIEQLRNQVDHANLNLLLHTTRSRQTSQTAQSAEVCLSYRGVRKNPQNSHQV